MTDDQFLEFLKDYEFNENISNETEKEINSTLDEIKTIIIKEMEKNG